VISIAEAQAHILGTVPAVRPEQLPLHLAYGRVLASPVASGVDVPPWDNSAMDGYAVRAEDTAAPPTTLALLETVGAGAVATTVVGPGTAVAVMTGAPVPPGADAVVMLEDTDRSRSGTVRIEQRARVGQHVRRAGEDVRRGDNVLTAGEVLGPAAVGLLGSLGQESVLVARQPRIALLGTGDEIVRPGTPLRPGQIWSSNHLSLRGWVLEAGGVPVDCGIAPDTVDATVRALRNAALDADAVVTTGGVSVGHFDVVKEAFALLGAPIGFWRVNMKPGKPLAFGALAASGPVLFGLPGNPVSCVVNFLQFVRPWIRRALGDPRPFLPVVTATLQDDLRDGPGRARLFRVSLTEAPDGTVTARSTGSQSSGVLTSLVRGHGLCVVAPEDPAPVAGQRVSVQVFDPGFRARATP
jgi:molybdopterin molybdotransferase